MSPLLEAMHLRLERGFARARRVILEDIDLTLEAGEVVMLIGPNGAGKSTLLSALAGDLAPAEGAVWLRGRLLNAPDGAAPRWSPQALARHRAMLTQRTRMTLDFTVEEVVRLGCLARELRQAERDDIVAAALAALALDELRRQPVPALSGGEQARVHLARVLAQLWPLSDRRPCVLLLDEPCADLDPFYQLEVCRVIRRFAADSGAGVVVSMHDMNLAAQYADRVLALGERRCLIAGTPREVLTRDFIQKCFGVDAAWIEHEGSLLVATHAMRERPRGLRAVGAASSIYEG